MRSRFAALLDYVADHIGNAYLFALVLAGIVGVVIALAAAVISGTWWAVGVVLALPALWLVMWRTSS